MALGRSHTSIDDRFVPHNSRWLTAVYGRFGVLDSFGAKRSLSGEVVFNTSMVGYPESLTDPS